MCFWCYRLFWSFTYFVRITQSEVSLSGPILTSQLHSFKFQTIFSKFQVNFRLLYIVENYTLVTLALRPTLAETDPEHFASQRFRSPFRGVTYQKKSSACRTNLPHKSLDYRFTALHLKKVALLAEHPTIGLPPKSNMKLFKSEKS